MGSRRSDVDELTDLWVRGDQRIARQVAAPVANAYVRGYVADFDAAARKASIREGTPDTEPTPNYDVPAWLHLNVGDYVLCYKLGSERVVRMPLDRNASVDQFANPLTKPGQIIIAGADGTATVIDPPADPTQNYALYWDGDTQQAVWVAV